MIEYVYKIEKEKAMTKQEYIGLLDLAVSMAEKLRLMWDEAFSHCKKES